MIIYKPYVLYVTYVCMQVCENVGVCVRLRS